MQSDVVFPDAASLATAVQKPALRAPWHFHMIAASSLAWSLLGVVGFVATLTRFPPYMAGFPDGAREYWATLPAWMFGIWALSVLSSFAGTLLMLQRRILAVRVLALSCVATIFAMALSYSRTSADFEENRVFAVCIIVISLLVFNYASSLSQRGVLR